ncbi:MAG: hypothetical protein ACKESA_00685, partial [Candidatus Hodgkinia cicadicola]
MRPSPVDGVLVLDNVRNRLATYVAIPDDPLIKPVVYDVGIGVVALGNCSRIRRNGLMITDNLSCSAYLDCYGLDRFAGLFIAEIQQIYDAQGVACK